MDKHLENIIQLALFAAFIGFTISSITLIKIVYTATPFSVYGVPVTVTINAGFIAIAAALVCLTILLWRRSKR